MLIAGHPVMSQAAYPYQDIKLEKPSDYIETGPLALSAANLILTSPFDEDDTKRANALKFLSSWMQGAKGYNFYTQGVAEQIRGDFNLLTLFIAALVKYNLTHKSGEVNSIAMEKDICVTLLNYAGNPGNNFHLKKKMRKILENNK